MSHSIVCVVAALTIGISWYYMGFKRGLKTQTREIEQKTAYMLYVMNEIKQKNNKMVDNLSKIYAMQPHDEGEFTEADAELFDMWID